LKEVIVGEGLLSIELLLELLTDDCIKFRDKLYDRLPNTSGEELIESEHYRY
jgi:hypothetical protein